MEIRYLIGIFFDETGKAFKYRYNIKDTQHYRQKFQQFAKEKHNATYVNWYDKISNTFIEQTKIV